MTDTQRAPSGQHAAELATAAAGVLATAYTVDQVTAALWPRFSGEGLRYRLALAGAVAAVMAFPPAAEGVSGPATMNIARLNLMRRAQFLVSAAWRISQQIVKANGDPRAAADATQAEARYYGQHMIAVWARTQAAARVDTAAGEHGRLLGWYTVHDAHTSNECRAADRHNFLADVMPSIGYPGAVHPNCRCEPGAPVRGGRMLPSIQTRAAIAA